eukprot:CAMPEP_0203758394 /NCGR_PEP_ID=MMETSP0098-20131031/11197_1 /ASSEMBLY_ACC=CAM_ASM_000208 /TAXON_ID=96639 /ORGANISM=" , Strain NY0313808BC1" /LENGTH=594 /DNA_ID=CAMNT_0050650789 /DNA_START=836 /DNA_END=2617 /DNA_ORIENTATION=-
MKGCLFYVLYTLFVVVLTLCNCYANIVLNVNVLRNSEHNVLHEIQQYFFKNHRDEHLRRLSINKKPGNGALYFVSKPDAGDLVLVSEFPFSMVLPYSTSSIDRSLVYLQKDPYFVSSDGSCSRGEYLDSMEFVLHISDDFNLVFQRKQNISVNVCIINSNSTRKGVHTARGKELTFDLRATLESNLTSIPNTGINLETSSLKGELFLHKCPDINENQSAVQVVTGIQYFAPRGVQTVCYRSSKHGDVYALKDQFRFKFADISLPLGGVAVWNTIQVKLLDSLTSATATATTEQDTPIVLQLTGTDPLAYLTSRTSVFVISTLPNVGRLVDPVLEKDISHPNQALSSNLVQFHPPSGFYNAHPGTRSPYRLSGSVGIGFDFFMHASDTLRNFSETSALSHYSIDVVRVQQALPGGDFITGPRKFFLEKRGGYHGINSITMSAGSDEDVFPFLINLKFSNVGHSFFRLNASSFNRISNTVYSREPLNASLRAQLTFAETWNASSRNIAPSCAEQGCNESLWVYGPMSALMKLVKTLELGSTAVHPDGTFRIAVYSENWGNKSLTLLQVHDIELAPKITSWKLGGGESIRGNQVPVW